MRSLFGIGAGAFALLVLAASLWLWLGKESDAAPGILTGQFDRVAAYWEANKISPARRVVNIIIGDAQSDADPLALVQAPSLWERVSARLGRAFERNPAAKVESQVCQAFADDPSAIRWTHEGFSAVTEEQMTKEIMAAIVKAHDVGAEINILTQGRSASAALKAGKSLEGEVRGGVPVGVNKAFSLGVNREQLKKLDPPFFKNFKKSKNFREWANVWAGGWPRRMILEVFVAGRDGEIIDAEELLRSLLGGVAGNLAQPALGLQELIRVVKALIASVQQLSERLDAVGKPTMPAAPPESPSPSDAVDSPPSQDSLNMIRGGEGMRLGDAAEPAPQAAAKKPRAKSWQETDKANDQCCSDRGGTWRAGTSTALGCCDGCSAEFVGRNSEGKPVCTTYSRAEGKGLESCRQTFEFSECRVCGGLRCPRN